MLLRRIGQFLGHIADSTFSLISDYQGFYYDEVASIHSHFYQFLVATTRAWLFLIIHGSIPISMDLWLHIIAGLWAGPGGSGLDPVIGCYMQVCPIYFHSAKAGGP